MRKFKYRQSFFFIFFCLICIVQHHRPCATALNQLDNSILLYTHTHTGLCKNIHYSTIRYLCMYVFVKIVSDDSITLMLIYVLCHAMESLLCVMLCSTTLCSHCKTCVNILRVQLVWRWCYCAAIFHSMVVTVWKCLLENCMLSVYVCVHFIFLSLPNIEMRNIGFIVCLLFWICMKIKV